MIVGPNQDLVELCGCFWGKKRMKNDERCGCDRNGLEREKREGGDGEKVGSQGL